MARPKNPNPVNRTLIQIRVRDELLAVIDKYADEHDLTRAAAAKALIIEGSKSN